MERGLGQHLCWGSCFFPQKNAEKKLGEGGKRKKYTTTPATNIEALTTIDDNVWVKEYTACDHVIVYFTGLCLYTIFIYFFNVCMYTWSYLGNWISFTKSRFKLESDHPRLNFICQSELSSNWKRILYERQSIEQFEMELIHSNQAICNSQWWGWG